MPRTKLLNTRGVQGIAGSLTEPGTEVELKVFIWTQKDNIVNFSGRIDCNFIENAPGDYFIGLVQVKVQIPVVANFTTELQATGVCTATSPSYASMSGNLFSQVASNEIIVQFEKTESTMDLATINFIGQYEIQPIVE